MTEYHRPDVPDIDLTNAEWEELKRLGFLARLFVRRRDRRDWFQLRTTGENRKTVFSGDYESTLMELKKRTQ